MLMGNYARADIGFRKGKGAVLWDLNGLDYIDFAAGIGVCSLGHSHSKLVKTISKQAKTLLHTSNLYKILPQEQLANKISQLLGKQYYLFFANSGAEANECAIKLARKYGASFEQKRSEIITLSNSFHGRTIATLKLTGQSKFHCDDFAPYPKGFKFYNSIDEIIKNLSQNTAAVMVELVQGEGGINPLQKAEVLKLEKVLKSKKILLITDEVQCGVYRTGEFSTSEIYGITPDIITFAKGLGGGVSIGACASRKDFFSSGDHGSTFGGNFLASKVSLRVLKELQELKESQKLAKTISKFKQNLDELVVRYPDIFINRVGLGLMQGLVLKNSKILAFIVDQAMKKRVLVLKSGVDTLRFLPPLNIKKDEIKVGFNRLRAALDEIIRSEKN